MNSNGNKESTKQRLVSASSFLLWKMIDYTEKIICKRHKYIAIDSLTGKKPIACPEYLTIEKLCLSKILSWAFYLLIMRELFVVVYML